MDTRLRNLLDYSLDELTQEIKASGMPAFRAKQIYGWIYQGKDFDEMTNLPKDMRTKLAEKYSSGKLKIFRKLTSKLDGTIKYLFDTGDGNLIESVLMKYKYGYTACISSQVGCKMGCTFCASAKCGFIRNLTPGECLGQIIGMNADNGITITRVVIMGIGEPLDNYTNVLKFLELVNREDGLNIGYRHISLSTCGLAEKIDDLAEKNLPITLSISLHASDNETRSSIMPVNKKWNIERLLGACKNYYTHTGRRISFEYTLISGKNDSREAALALAALLNRHLRGVNDTMPIHVNLIPVNPVTESGFSSSEKKTVAEFAATLERKGVRATVRRTLGADINASCGQLRREEEQNKN